MGDEVTGRGWIKLEIPEPDEARYESIVQTQIDKLQPAIEAMGMQVVKQTEMQRIEEQDCDTYFEINFEVADTDFNEKIIHAIRNYLLDLNKDGFIPFQRGNLVLHSPDFFSNALKCCVENVRLSAIYFGNLQGGLFINHWEVSFWKELMEREKKIRNGLRNEDSGLVNQLFGDFEFDKTDMVTVHFRQREMQDIYDPANQTRKRQQVTVYYQITVKRNTIRRIICDPAASDVNGTNRFRIHFDLNCPVLIRRAYTNDRKEQKHATPMYARRLTINRGRCENQFPAEAAISDSPIFTIEFDQSVSMREIYMLLSRLRVRTGAAIEFSHHPAVDCLIWRENPYHKWSGNMRPTDAQAPIYHDFLQSVFPKKITVVGSKEFDVNKERRFAITYLIECLLSRGAVVKDQLLLDQTIWTRFLQIMAHYLVRDNKLCEAALEELVHMLDSRKRIGSLLKCLDRICHTRLSNQLVNGLTDEEIRDGFQRVRKIIVTPTRTIYVAPETLMGNRVLRKYDLDGTRVLRVTFRDEDNTRMRHNKTSDVIIERTVMRALSAGLNIAGRSFGYLGSSNSQMRDNGAYFMEKYSSAQLHDYWRQNPSRNQLVPPDDFNPKIQSVRKALGRFEKIDNIPKMMARLGQCFTQSRMSGVDLDRKKYFTTSDLVGGKNSKGDEYTFSDGVGMISYSFAKQISNVMGLGCGVPSCFQFRFRGMKGVISVEPLLDEISRWATQNGVLQMDDDHSWDINCVFRPSQIKFIAKRHPRDQVEIVKYSAPVPVALNKPFINILDQVSEMQSLECHRRVTNRIEELLDRVMQGYAQAMIDETQCRNRLKELPRRIDVDYLRTTSGFTLSNEPFFRSLIKASIKYSITKQLRKEQIPVPFELGRSMLGVVDETGQLQYGQIFVQYTKNIALKLPPPTAARNVLTGKVLVTKNPCIVSGDVRVFEAVDVPELHHMCDVIVFPQSGPRPHPDEMAGSDLDGDEYSVIWDQKMLLDRNEEPFDFTSDKKKEDFTEADVDRLMREFYIKYLKLDSVGTISNSHLHLSDQYGLNSTVCMNLAKKNCQAVDFTKSGEPPEPLVNKWVEDEVTGELIPPERPERVPDYHIGNDYSPMYVSSRLIGKLFREFKAIDDVLKLSEERDEQMEITLDEMIYVPGYEQYMPVATEQLAKYNAQLRGFMETYGIRTEGEIFSGCIVEMRNRISDKDQDDMSFYNTNHMIETKVSGLFRKYREEFFKDFGGWHNVTEKSNRMGDENNILHCVCRVPSNEMLQKAVAYYRACYEEAKLTRENKKLSFAWLVYDILHEVKLHAVLAMDNFYTGTNPLYTMLENHRRQFCLDRAVDFERYRRFDREDSLNQRVQIANDILHMYATSNPGLERVLFILAEWARVSKLLSRSMKSVHLALLVVLFATGHYGSVDGNTAAYINKIDEKDYHAGAVGVSRMSESEQTRLMTGFLQFLSSRKFRKQDYITFLPLGLSSVFMRGQWVAFHVSALKTFYNMLFNLRFEELPLSTDPAVTVRTIVRENDPFVIELPEQADEVLVRTQLMQRTGVEDVQLRRLRVSQRHESQQRVRYLVSTRGSMESVYKLRQLVAVKVPMKTSVSGQEMSAQLASLCYEKIINDAVSY